VKNSLFVWEKRSDASVVRDEAGELLRIVLSAERGLVLGGEDVTVEDDFHIRNLMAAAKKLKQGGQGAE
jgi:hypothetical protein